MELSINLYTFSKKFNSTKQPDVGATTASCVWKSPYSTDEPDIEMRAEDIPATANYAYIPEFGRYYWIDKNRKYRDSGHADIKLITDVLATYKPYILQQTFFIDKNEHTYNSAYSDSRIACTGNRLIGESTVEIPELAETSYGMYYVEIVGAESSGTFTNKYIMSPFEMGEIATKVMDNENVLKAFCEGVAGVYSDENSGTIADAAKSLIFSPGLGGIINIAMQNGIEDAGTAMSAILSGFGNSLNALTDSVQEYILKPGESIVKIKALACDTPNIFTSERKEVYLGKLDAEITARYLSNSLSTLRTLTLSIPWKYVSADGGILDFRNRAEYTTATLNLPTGDNINLPVNRMYGFTSLTIEYRINASTGEVMGNIKVGTDDIGGFVFNISSSISTAYRNELTGGVTMGILSSIPEAAMAASGNYLPFAFMGAGKIVGNVVNPTIESAIATVRGSTAECMLMDTNFTLIISSVQTQSPAELNPLGRLLRKPMQLGSLTGFTICEQAYANVPATYDEQIRINNFLNSGFYIE